MWKILVYNTQIICMAEWWWGRRIIDTQTHILVETYKLTDKKSNPSTERKLGHTAIFYTSKLDRRRRLFLLRFVPATTVQAPAVAEDLPTTEDDFKCRGAATACEQRCRR